MFIRPDAVRRRRPGSRLAQEEIFGPVLAAIAVRRATRTRSRSPTASTYGLTASVFTSDLALAHRFARDVEAGFVWVNDVAHALPRRARSAASRTPASGARRASRSSLSYTQIKNVNIRFQT